MSQSRYAFETFSSGFVFVFGFFPAHANLSAVGIGALEEPDVARGCLVRRATSGTRIIERDVVCALIDFSQ